jgi:iron complex outermembrane recepter protein
MPLSNLISPLSARHIDGHPRRQRGFRYSVVFSAALCAAAANAQVVAETTLKSVEIKGQALLQSGSSPTTKTTFDADEIRELSISQPEQLFSRVPGMRVNTYGLGGVVNVISLRGFGGGAHGGDLGFVLDGIPLNEAISHSDGYADLNVVVPLELQRVDVVKGPSSVLVGNYNRAGTVFLQTRKGGEYQLGDITIGSFGTYDLQAAGGFKLGGGALNLAAQAFTTNDFRPQSGFDRYTLSGRYTMDFAGTEVSVSGRTHRGTWDSASYLTQTQFQAGDPYGKDPRAQNDGGQKTFNTLRVDVARDLTPNIKLLGFAYGTNQTYTRYFSRPVNATVWRQREEDYDRDVTGFGLSLNGQDKLGGMPLKWTAGLERYRESTDFNFFDGTTQRARVGAPVFLQSRTYAFNSTSAFAEAELAVSPLFRPTVGVRADRYTGDCAKRGPEVVAATDPPCNTPLKDVSHTSPKLGVRSTVAPGVDLRASYNQGFALANVRGLYSPTNNTVPNTFKQKEVGVILGPWSGLTIDAAVFQLDSDNEIRELPAGSGQFFNSGRTRRTGVDLSVLWAFARDWDTSLAYGSAEGKIRENPNAAIIGKKLNGIPQDTATLSVNYAPDKGFGGFASANHVGSYFYDSAGLNLQSQAGYNTLDAGVTWRGQAGRTGVKARLAVNNLTNKVYASNSFQIGGVNLVAPGAPRNLQATVQFEFN